jgi:hypothetical protein
MSTGARREYLKEMRMRYQKEKVNCNRKGMSALLNEAMMVTRYNRKYLIALFNGKRKSSHGKVGAKPIYSLELLHHFVKELYFLMEQPGPLKMKAALPLWLPYYERYGFTDKLRSDLLEMSASTLEIILNKVRKSTKKGLPGTRRGNLLKNRIPLQTTNWDEKKPGFMEADTVHHCGNSLMGEYAMTLTMTDIASTWTENRAMFSKAHTEVIAAVKSIEETLPFPLLGTDSDNGTEFINYDFIKYLTERPNPVKFTRSRPYKKNDQAHVEQKNYTHVRCLVGYDRIPKRYLAEMLNKIYIELWNPLHNFFLPSMKIVRKVRIGSKIKRTYEKPKTAYQRLLESADMSIEAKKELQQRFAGLNPFELKQKLEDALKTLFDEQRKYLAAYREEKKVA